MLSLHLNNRIQTLVHGKVYIAKVTIEVDADNSILISGNIEIIKKLAKQLRIELHSRNSLYISPESCTTEYLVILAKQIRDELELLPNTEVNYLECS